MGRSRSVTLDFSDLLARKSRTREKKLTLRLHLGPHRLQLTLHLRRLVRERQEAAEGVESVVNAIGWPEEQAPSIQPAHPHGSHAPALDSGGNSAWSDQPGLEARLVDAQLPGARARPDHLEGGAGMRGRLIEKRAERQLTHLRRRGPGGARGCLTARRLRRAVTQAPRAAGKIGDIGRNARHTAHDLFSHAGWFSGAAWGRTSGEVMRVCRTLSWSAPLTAAFLAASGSGV